jgi:5S rRNA maturation endonuclease (ribonuclease M5)
MPLDFNPPNLRVVGKNDNRKERIREAVHQQIDAFVKFLLPNAKPQGNGYRVGDIHGAHGASLSITTKGNGIGRWYDHADAPQGDIFTLWAEINNLSVDREFSTVLDQMEGWLGGKVTTSDRVRHESAKAQPRPKAKVKIGEESYPYLSLTGEPIVTVHKYLYEGNKKEFRMYRHSDGQWKAPDVRPLYNLPGIAKADTVIFVEGEKCAQALIEQGFAATCIMGGAKAPLEKNDWSPLAAKQIVIWPDNDEPGFGLAGRVKNVLNSLAGAIRVVDIPHGKPEGWDVADAIGAGEDVTAYLGTAKRKTLPILSVADLASLEPPEWLIDGLLVKGGLSTLFAPAETFKSFIALDMALSISAGQSWRGKETISGPVVYLIGEGVAGWPARVFTWLKHRHEGQTPDFYTVPTAIQMNETEDAQALIDLVLSVCEAPSMIVVDTLARNFGGGDENSTQDMNAFVRSVDRIREATGAHVMLVHHTGKDMEKGGRGSSVLRAALDTEMQCFRDDPDGYDVTLKITKQKDIEKAEPIHFEMVKSEAVHPSTGEVIFSLIPVLREASEIAAKPIKLAKKDKDIANYLWENGSHTTKQLGEIFPHSESNLKRILYKLRDAGEISSLADGKHTRWEFVGSKHDAS